MKKTPPWLFRVYVRDEKLPSYVGISTSRQFIFRGSIAAKWWIDLEEINGKDVPWKSNHHLLKVGFRTTTIVVGVYHLPKGTTIFKMVLDFPGIFFSGSCWVLQRKQHPKPEVGLGNGTLPETGLRGRQCSLALSKKVLFEGKGWSKKDDEMDRSMGCFFVRGLRKVFFLKRQSNSCYLA